MSKIPLGTSATEQRWEEAENSGDQKFWALRNVSFQVQPGDVVGVIGRNGAGKSTLLKLLSRITAPSTGEIVLNGRVGSLLEVGTGFHPELTGRENVYMNGTILGMRKHEIDEKFDEIVAFAEIDQFIDTPVKRYSSGMYVRLAFAVAAHLEPEILVVDEVLAVGDISFQKKCLGKMSDVSLEGRTVLFVSHNMPAVLRLCKQGLLLDKGENKLWGPINEVVDQYTQEIADSGTNRNWEENHAPGSAKVRLLGVSLVNENDQPITVASVEDTLCVRMLYRVYTPGERFRCILVFNTQGICAFGTMELSEYKRERTGIYSSTVTIPKNLLAEGEYTVNVSIISSRGVKIRHVSERNIFSFQVVDPINGESARGDYGEGYAGVIRPKLDWEIRHLGQ
jgi:lipopolysaccharide transport system ATP-binding protein